MTLGEYIVALLERYGVTHVFGIPGVHNVELYRGLTGSRLTHVTPRHEQAAGFMADGFARASGRPAACFVITGPGLANIATAMGQAAADSIPMLVISTNNPAGRRGSGDGWLHEMKDQAALAGAVAGSTALIGRVEEAPQAFARAFAMFACERALPAHIDIPLDLLSQPADHLSHDIATLSPPGPDARSIAQAAAMLKDARAPVMLVGGGARRADVTGLAEALDAPVCLTANARGLMAPGHPLALSHSATLTATRNLIAGADVVIAIGTEIGPTDYDPYDDGGFRLPGALIRVDIDAQQAMRNAPPTLALIGDASLACAALRDAVTPTERDGAARVARARREGDAELTPTYSTLVTMLDEVRATLPGCVMVGDSTQLVYAGNLAFAAPRPGAWFNASTGFGALGYGLPAAIGAALALQDDPSRIVVALIGDGGLQFSLAELGSAVEAGVPLIVLLWNNRGYGEIRAYMESRGIAPIGVSLHTPDFQMLARSFGWVAETLEALDALPERLRAAAARGGQTLIETDEDTALSGVAR
jgi:acetolactate synthase-1/2/3 large subunit